MHSFCSNNGITLWNAAKSLKIQSIRNFKIQNLPILHLPASLLYAKPTCSKCIAPEILHDKGDHIGFSKLLFWWTFIHCIMAFSFILYYLFQITYRKVRNLQISVDKLVQKVLINLLSGKVSHLHNQHNYDAPAVASLHP